MHKNKYKIHSEFVSFSNNFLFGWRHTHTCTRHDLQQRLQHRMKQRHKTHKYFAATGTKNVKFFFSLYCLNVWQNIFFLLSLSLLSYTANAAATRPVHHLFHVDALVVFRLFYHHFSEHINFLIKLLFDYLVNYLARGNVEESMNEVLVATDDQMHPYKFQLISLRLNWVLFSTISLFADYIIDLRSNICALILSNPFESIRTNWIE